MHKQNLNTKRTTRTTYYKDNKRERERMQINLIQWNQQVCAARQHGALVAQGVAAVGSNPEPLPTRKEKYVNNNGKNM